MNDETAELIANILSDLYDKKKRIAIVRDVLDDENVVNVHENHVSELFINNIVYNDEPRKAGTLKTITQ